MIIVLHWLMDGDGWWHGRYIGITLNEESAQHIVDAANERGVRVFSVDDACPLENDKFGRIDELEEAFEIRRVVVDSVR